MWLLLGLSWLSFSLAAQYDDDLLTFVTLPHVRTPRYRVTYYDRNSVSSGYWFVAPYGAIEPEAPTQKWQPCQVGPYIFDGDGMLIWAGSCMFDNRNVFDFKAVENSDDSYHLSFVLQHAYENDGAQKGHGYVLSERYEVESAAPVTNDLSAFNMHEFNVLDGGKTALACAYRPEYMTLGDLGRPKESSWVMTGGFVELNTKTGDIIFEWMSPGHIPIDESAVVDSSSPSSGWSGWDYIHVNSVDKNEAGDYLLSARFSNTIYLVSGRTRKIIWRLGGKYSDFMQDFVFSRQHNARFVESNSTHITLSFLNNASDERSNQEKTSSALYVQVDMSASPMTARVVRRFRRPDGGLTRLRGNVQTLPNGNTFVGWSEQGYHSEHSRDGRLLMQASFASARFSSYRSYKFPFRGRPRTPPDIVASVYGANIASITTVIYVSWNGATDIASWNFYAKADARGPSVLVGNANKTDFETMYIADGYLDWISAEALDKEGNPLGISKSCRSIVPSDWEAVGFRGPDKPTPADPSLLSSSKHNESSEGIEIDVIKASEPISEVKQLLAFILTICSVGGALTGIYLTLGRKIQLHLHNRIPVGRVVHGVVTR